MFLAAVKFFSNQNSQYRISITLYYQKPCLQDTGRDNKKDLKEEEKEEDRFWWLHVLLGLELVYLRLAHVLVPVIVLVFVDIKIYQCIYL